MPKDIRIDANKIQLRAANCCLSQPASQKMLEDVMLMAKTFGNGQNGPADLSLAFWLSEKDGYKPPKPIDNTNGIATTWEGMEGISPLSLASHKSRPHLKGVINRCWPEQLRISGIMWCWNGSMDQTLLTLSWCSKKWLYQNQLTLSNL